MAGAGAGILPVRERAAVIREVLQKRLDTLLPLAMRQAGLDLYCAFHGTAPTHSHVACFPRMHGQTASREGDALRAYGPVGGIAAKPGRAVTAPT